MFIKFDPRLKRHFAVSEGYVVAIQDEGETNLSFSIRAGLLVENG